MEKLKVSVIFIVLVLLISTTALLFGCEGEDKADKPTGEPANQLEKIQQRGKLIVATSPDFAPAEFIDSSKTGQDQYIGSEISMAKFIAARLGVELEIEAMDFSAVLSAVSLGTADVAMSSFGWTKERESSFELSNGFNIDKDFNRFCFLVRKSDADKYQTLGDFSGKKIAAQTSSLQETYTKQQVPDAIMEQITSVDVGIMMLKKGKVDALSIHYEQAGGFTSTNPDLVTAKPELDIEYDVKTTGNVLAVKKGEILLINRLNEIVKEINDKELFPQWLIDAKVEAKNMGIEFDGSKEFVAPEKEKGIWTVFIENYGLFFDGLIGTLKLAALTLIFATLLGALFALLQLSGSRILRYLAVAYIEVIRGTPVLVQLYIFYFIVPDAFPMFELSKYTCVVISLVINSSAYIAEIMRSGIQSVDTGQAEAAKSLGLNSWHVTSRIVLPQAIKNILPALCNEFVTVIKQTSLASVLFINELMYARTLLQSTKFYTWQPLFIIAIIYFVVTFILSRLIRILERRLKVSD